MIPLAQRAHAIYVMWADDTAVYVGMTSNWEQRFNDYGVWWPSDDEPLRSWNIHRGHSHVITHVDVWFVDLPRTDARELESALIELLAPTHNRTGPARRVPSRDINDVLAEAVT